MKLTSTKKLKWFSYVSRPKLKMLASQLSEPAKRKTEAKLDVKVASITATVERDEADITSERLVDDVVSALDDRGLVGSVDEPLEYFRGTLPMRWGVFEDHGRPENESPLVYFGGYTARTIFGLGGSTRHVLGCEGMSNTSSRSVTPFLVHHLIHGMEMEPEGWKEFDSEGSSSLAFEAIVMATSQLRQQTLSMEFVARTLLRGSVYHPIITENKPYDCLLGTPLYVAFGKPFIAHDPWHLPWKPSNL